MRYLILILVLFLAACETAEPALTPTSESALFDTATAQAAPLTDEATAVTTEVEAPTQEAEIVTEAEAVVTTQAAAPIPTVEGALNLPADVVIPLPGEIVLAAVTEAPEEAAAPFDYILYTQDGGPANVSITIEVYSDGRVVRNGESRTVSPQSIAALDQKIKDINFFNIQGIFTTAGASQDIYRYTITVEGGLGSKMIRAQDGYTPQPLLELFSQVITLTEGR